MTLTSYFLTHILISLTLKPFKSIVKQKKLLMILICIIQRNKKLSHLRKDKKINLEEVLSSGNAILH